MVSMCKAPAELLQHASKIFGMALRVSRNPKIAERILQEVFLEASSKIDSFNGDCTTIEARLLRIVLKTVNEKFRDQNGAAEEALDSYMPRFDSNGQMLETVESLPLHVENETERKRLTDALQLGISRLPYGYRIILVASDISALSTQDIAQALGLPVSTVKTRLHQGRLFLTQRLMISEREEHFHCCSMISQPS